MGDLYWSSLANSLIDYYWFNLLKRNRFWHGVTVLWPKCYTLEVKLGTIDTVYNTNIAQLREPGSCIPPLPILSCYAAFTGFQYTVCFNTSFSHTVQYSKNILNMHISLDELRHQVRLELHPSDFSCVLEIQYGQLVFQFLVSNFLQMIHSLLKFL